MEKITSLKEECLHKHISSLPCQYPAICAAWNTFFRQPKRVERSVVLYTSGRNVISDNPVPRSNYRGKLLCHTMRTLRFIIQHGVNFLRILAYPIYQTKNFHQRLIDRPTRSMGKCSEQRVSIVLFVYLMALFTGAYAHDPHPTSR